MEDLIYPPFFSLFNSLKLQNSITSILKFLFLLTVLSSDLMRENSEFLSANVRWNPD